MKQVCIHTTQGYDINYVGVIFGFDIDYCLRTNKIIVLKENYYDQNGKKSTNDQDLHQYVINTYRTLLLRGIKGGYVYCCNENLREYFKDFITVYKSKKEK